MRSAQLSEPETAENAVSPSSTDLPLRDRKSAARSQGRRVGATGRRADDANNTKRTREALRLAAARTTTSATDAERWRLIAATRTPRVRTSWRHLIARRVITIAVASVALLGGTMIALPGNGTPARGEIRFLASTVGGQNVHLPGGYDSPLIDQSDVRVTNQQLGSAVVTTAPGGETNFDWAAAVLQDGGWPISENNVTIMTEWMYAENPPTHWWTRNNPLNNGYGSGGGAGLGSYSSLLIAAQDVAVNLQRGGGYSQIVADLAVSASPSTTASAIWASPWAGSHYEYGSHWHTTSIQSVAAPASAWGS